MSLVERLDKLAKQFDRERWSANGTYWPEKAEQCDLILEAAKTIRSQRPFPLDEVCGFRPRVVR